MKRITGIFLVCVGLSASFGCDRTPTTPTPTGGATSITQVFSGTLVPGETPSFTFSLPGAAPLYLTFGSLTTPAGLPLGTGVTLKFGVVPDSGTGCNALTRVPATAALKAHIAVVASTGTYCVGLEDTGGVPITANFSIRVIYGTPTDQSGSGSITYTSTVLPTGFTSRSFGAAVSGVATVIMDSISPATVSTLGIGLGFPRNDGTGCEVAISMIATRASQLHVPVDAGKYCVKIFDPGTLTDTATFVIRIVHP